WGDGSISAGTIQGDGGSFVVLGTHTYAEEHDGYNTKVSITDTGGQQATVIGTANVADAPLSATPVAVSATEGASFSGSAATFTDADPNGTLTDYSATIDWGDQTSTTAGDITKNADGSYTVSGGHTYVEEGSYSVTVTINDKGGSTTTAKSTATVADAPLTATGGFTITATEGQASASQTVATFTDADPNGTLSDYSASIDWGDGTTATAGTVSENADGSFAVNGDHTYGEEGSYTVTVTISDEGGSQTVANDTASVADAGLTATSQNILSGSGTAYNGAVATFKDANPTAPLSDFSATIDWGDSTAAAAGTISQNADGSFTVSGTHTFAALGPHTVTVHIVDEGGSTADATTQILSYAYLGQGSFVLGDQTVANAAPGTTVTWWGAQWDAQWAGNDTLSGGPAPTDFKGFAQSLSGTPPVAGGSWTTLPGTSPMPPDSVPTYMAVIVTSHVTESGSTITGNIVHLVIVKTDPGYGPNAGHAGTGTIVATVF
ncbi:MAG TPA: hypothetical protein VFU72_15860, partial [Nitrolancea sp.]|nr:hypothetical protein [Nitrolancea sp.]